MAKPNTFDGYNNQNTLDCERVLVTLLRGLGPWKESVCLIGGLTPRYLVSKRPPDVRPHAGTLDVDVVIDLQILADTEAYYTLEENITRMGFERAKNDKGESLSWRWQTRTDRGALIILEFLADHPVLLVVGLANSLPTAKSQPLLSRTHLLFLIFTNTRTFKPNYLVEME